MRLCWALLLVVPASAHTISMSHGVLRVDGSVAVYQLRMPQYEMTHITNPEQTLFSAIRFSSAGVDGKAVQRSCHNDPGFQAFICDAVYQFPKPIDSLEIRCEFARVTVPNHIHLLRAVKGSQSDQAVFDDNIETAELRFRPPTHFEAAIKNVVAGVIRAATSLLALVFLAGLAVAARSWREFGSILIAFFAGQAISCALLPNIRFDPSPRFIEIAMLLTIGYLVVEIIFLPDGSGRWLVCGVLGLFHGLYYALLMREGGFNPPYVLGGVFLVEAVASTACYLLWRRVERPVTRALSSVAMRSAPSR